MSETVRMVCSRCGSEEVVADAYAEWNVDSQAWEIVQTFDKGAYRTKCDGETRIEEQPAASTPSTVPYTPAARRVTEDSLTGVSENARRGAEGMVSKY
jgi:hypothetical protein